MVCFTCGVCDETFEGAEAFIAHHSLHSSMSPNWLLCSQSGCFTTIGTLKNFRQHIRKHDGSRGNYSPFPNIKTGELIVKCTIPYYDLENLSSEGFFDIFSRNAFD